MGLTQDSLPRVAMPASQGSWSVRVRGPEPVASALRAAVHGLGIEGEDLGALDVDIRADGCHAQGAVGGRQLWSISVPPRRALSVLLGQVVATATTLLTRFIFVHAGAVAVNGRAWLLVGESGAGKTSIVAALLQRHATYLSDEVALLDPAAGTVASFDLPMAIKPWTLTAAGSLPPGREVTRDGDVLFLRPACATAPVPVGMFIFLGRGGRARVTPIPPTVALLELARQPSSFQLAHRLDDAFTGFTRALRSARCVRFDGPCPAASADLLIEAAARIVDAPRLPG